MGNGLPVTCDCWKLVGTHPVGLSKYYCATIIARAPVLIMPLALPDVPSNG